MLSLTCVDGEGLHADPPAVDFPKNRAQLRKRVASVVMVAENCMSQMIKLRNIF